MKSDCIYRNMLPRLLVVLMVIALVLATGTGCSKKANADDTDALADGAAGAAELNGEEIDNFAAVKENILDSISKSYSDYGLKIASVELEDGSDGARITLSWPEHTPEQTVLAGVRVLKDNFPRTRSFVSVVGGKKHTCGSTEFAYIVSKGYSFETTEEEAVAFMDIVKNGIPDEDADQPIALERI
jgi:hypothetical protein